MAEHLELCPRVQAALELLEQTLEGLQRDLDLAADAGHPATAAEAELDLLADRLEQLVILAGGGDG